MKIQSIKLPITWKLFWLLIVISLVSLSLSFSPRKQNNPDRTVPTATPTPTISPTKETPSPTIKPRISKTLGTVVITTPEPTKINPTSPPSQSSELQVTLSINNGPSFSVTLPSGSNQCDVLNEALKEGKISSLNMKYDSAFGSYGVYQINGIGKDNQIWWTYKVNGQSPPRGCSYIKVNNNDSVSWLYTGS